MAEGDVEVGGGVEVRGGVEVEVAVGGGGVEGVRRATGRTRRPTAMQGGDNGGVGIWGKWPGGRKTARGVKSKIAVALA